MQPHFLEDRPETDPEICARVWPGLDQFAGRLSYVLEHLPASSPAMVSGDWGAGKTTLLRAVGRRMEKDRAIIWFEAWRHNGEQSLLPALLRAVWDAAPEGWRGRQAPGFLRELLMAGLLVGVRAAPELLRLAGVPVVPEVLAGLTPKAMAEEGEAWGKTGAWEPTEDPTAVLWGHFATLTGEAWAGQKPPLILIDDLDRCDPATMVALLDHLRLLVAGAAELHCRFTVAMDRSIVAQAVARKFEGISGYDGNRYLEKVFPIAFTLPLLQPAEVAALISHAWGPGNDGTDLDHRDALTRALQEPVFANPRLIKRCVTRYQLVQFMESSKLEALKNRYLARWIAATERWPRLRSLLLRHNDETWEQISKKTSHKQEDFDSEVFSLLSEQGARSWLVRELFGNLRIALPAFRDAETRLQALGL